MAWNFKREESTFTEINPGRYRVMITDAEMATSKRGNDMLVIKMLVGGTGRYIWNYITFLDDRPEITNRMLTQFFDSFDIEDGNFNVASYKGKFGGVQIKHDDDGRARVSYFLNKRQQETLPDWEGETPDFKPVEEKDEDLPF